MPTPTFETMGQKPVFVTVTLPSSASPATLWSLMSKEPAIQHKVSAASIVGFQVLAKQSDRSTNRAAMRLGDGTANMVSIVDAGVAYEPPFSNPQNIYVSDDDASGTQEAVVEIWL